VEEANECWVVADCVAAPPLCTPETFTDGVAVVVLNEVPGCDVLLLEVLREPEALPLVEPLKLPELVLTDVSPELLLGEGVTLDEGDVVLSVPLRALLAVPAVDSLPAAYVLDPELGSELESEVVGCVEEDVAASGDCLTDEVEAAFPESALAEEVARESAPAEAWLLVVEVCACRLNAAANSADVPHTIHFPEVFILPLLRLVAGPSAHLRITRGRLAAPDSRSAVPVLRPGGFRRISGAYSGRFPLPTGHSMPRNRTTRRKSAGPRKLPRADPPSARVAKSGSGVGADSGRRLSAATDIRSGTRTSAPWRRGRLGAGTKKRGTSAPRCRL
jgi:hypothetical protein